MQYSSAMADERERFLGELGRAVRERRTERGMTRNALSEKAGVSVRFIAELEAGRGNISVGRLHDVAVALGTTAAALLAAEARSADVRPGIVALLGLRGAGKSTVGPRLARHLGLKFVELDDLVARASGLSLAEVFELHGEAYYRRLERETLRRFLAESAPAVVATGGSIVNDRETYRLLRERAVTVWLKARPEDHWNRVVKQGDRRPMGKNPHAFEELKALLDAREPLYATADHTVDTTTGLDATVVACTRALGVD